MIERSRFEAVYQETYGSLQRYIGGMTGRDSLVEDILQESYLRLLVSAPARLSDTQLKSYLFTTATNLVRDRWRHGGVAGDWMSLEESTAKLSAAPEPLDEKMDVASILKKLSIMQRSLIWLAYAEGFGHREIAAITGLKEKSVRVLLFRARRRCAEWLRSEGDIPGEEV